MVSRRTFLGATSALVGVAGAGLPVRWPAGVHADIVADAAMVWKRPPASWQDAPFLGNGLLGVQVYRGAGNSLTFMLSHTKVIDQRPQWVAAVGLSRLPIGSLALIFQGSITAVDWTLDLWNAELTGTVTTTRGSTSFAALVQNDRGILLVELVPSDGERDAAWTFTPLPAATTRNPKPPDYAGNPPVNLGDGYAEQPLSAGGGYTTAWQERQIGTRRLLAATVNYGFPSTTGKAQAIASVRSALSTYEPLIVKHRRWWNAFYVRSLVSVPDKKIQRFYWIQLYKTAAATRADAPVVTEWGPWFPAKGNNWTAVWWNLNVQIAYWHIQGSNHHELDAVTNTLYRSRENLALSVPEEYRDGQSYALAHPSDWLLRPGAKTVGIPGTSTKTDNTGNLIWAVHNVWLTYRHTMDRRILGEIIVPILSKAVNFYAHFLSPQADGYLHLALTRSPEYADAEDCTYDLSLIRWACRTLVAAGAEPIQRWRDILVKLVPYHRDATGVMIGKDVPLSSSHRHFSHLLWLYPLQEASDPALMRQSFDHWAGMQSLWHGYSLAVASSMASVMNSPEEALRYLRAFIDGTVIGDTQITPNTMYREGNNFALESPLTGAQSLLDMVSQSAHGVVKVFPSISASWPEASIQNIRCQGAFLLDASRKAGATEWVRIRSEAGAALVLQHGIAGDIDVRDENGRRLPWKPAGDGRISVPLRQGRSAVVSRRGERPDPRPRDVPASEPAPPWGLP
ncbi:glycosyl hydrolase family 95 catalytic domain-containing protein [Fodinicola acaciae]|uniref:glycosyl hydrolase family 95 catalytic domain-containing protein n=1 Tax=Fodinicola acaciae TaxID=2681555 RepID=UPI0013D8DFB5|nr:twin-arginine translocation signal domain-containing protein [Fodinicola acaciae]